MSSVRRIGRADELKQTVYPSDAYTAVKHTVYRRYAQCWMGKILRKFEQGATIVDAFSGAGAYSDGLDGSPIVFARTFLEHSALADFYNLEVLCLDEREDRAEHLKDLATALPREPRLRVQPMHGLAADRLKDLADMAHARNTGRPVLWVLDPYGWADVPVDMALKCLRAGPRDEVIISLFTEEMYRFASDITKQPTLTRVVGGEHWREAIQPGQERVSKEALADAYRQSLAKAGLYTGKFAVAARERMPRYHLIYATHREKALAECWNTTTWYLDKYAGGAAGPIEVSNQGDLFDFWEGRPETDELRRRLESYAGEQFRFSQLQSEAVAMGFKVTHLRQQLTAMRKAGMAIRVDVDGSRSEWPESCVVRFYNATDNE